jgi:hypothetical protein
MFSFRYTLTLAVSVLLGTLHVTQAQQIAMNEIMASNSLVNQDEDGDYEDWIEIYNYGQEAVNLENIGLSDNYKNPFKWVFPAITLQPGAYLLVWASGKDRKTPGSPLHTNFSISASGEGVILSHPQLGLIDEHQPIPMSANVSYGRKPDGTGSWAFFAEPSPGISNSTRARLLDPPSFSNQGGFYSGDFNLTLSHSEPGVTIVYTLDGSEPDSDNIGGKSYSYLNSYPENPDSPMGPMLTNTYQSFTYTGPIPIYDRKSEPNKLSAITTTWDENPNYIPNVNVDKAIVVRAKTIKDGDVPSNVVTQTYFVNQSGTNEYKLPVISISIRDDYFFDYEKGIYVAGVDFVNWRIANPDTRRSGRRPANYQRRGDDWEYPATLEYFLSGSSSSVLNQDVGVRIHGGYTRSWPNKSLRIYARNSYGNSHLEYPFFSSIPEHKKFKRIILRNSGSDANRTLLRDATIQEIVSGLNFDTQASQPSLVFINGEYWGLHNIRERFDRYYIGRTHNVDKNHIDMLSHNVLVKEGDAEHYNAMINFIRNNGLNNDKNYDYIKTQMDIYNYIDYMVAQIYINNQDWPGNNIDFWRYRANEVYPEQYFPSDGRWRWMLFDTDWGFGRYDPDIAHTQNTLLHAMQLGNYEWATILFRSMLENESFKQDFIIRFSDIMNSHLSTEHSIEVINKNRNIYAPEIPGHISRWRSHGTFNRWNYYVNEMIKFAELRPAYQRQHIREYFNIADDIEITVDIDNIQNGYIRVNTIDIHPRTPGIAQNTYPWSGTYFHNIPVEIKAIPNEGYIFSHWEGSSNSTDAVLKLKPTQSLSLKAHFERLKVKDFIHYWHFNRLNGTQQSIAADYSVLGNATITYPGSGTGYMDERTHRSEDPVSSLNLFLGQEANQGAVLRVRNPASTRELIITSPTTGYQEIAVSFATTRTTNGAQNQEFYYSHNGGASWSIIAEVYAIPELDITQVNNGWKLISFDLSSIVAINNNPDVQFKILFTGEGADLHNGNHRFDNFSVRGIPITVGEPYQLAIMSVNYGNPVFVDKEFQLLIHVLDNQGLRANVQSDTPVNLTLANGTGNLLGTTNLNLPEGESSIVFDELIYDSIENDVSIEATASTLQSITSEPFNVLNSTVGNPDEKINLNFNVFPNPTNGFVTIQTTEEFLEIALYNLHGIQVYSEKNLKTFEHKINVSSYDNGIYILKLTTAKGFITDMVKVLKK